MPIEYTEKSARLAVGYLSISVFSNNVNRLIGGDETFAKAPPDSIVGILRDRLIRDGFVPADFPVLTDVFAYLAANIGKKEDWGKVPVSVPEENHPSSLPLQVVYNARNVVDQCLAPLREDKSLHLRAAVLSLSDYRQR